MSLITELLALRRRAEVALATVPALADLRPQCHLAVLRTHIDYTSYTLFADSEASNAAALTRSWEREEDESDFDGDPATSTYPVDVLPTISSWRTEVPAERVDAIMRRAARLRVPARVSRADGGTDGTIYVLAFADFVLASARFTWWQSSWMNDAGFTQDGPPPPGWESLFSVAQEIVQLAGGPVWSGPHTRLRSPRVDAGDGKVLQGAGALEKGAVREL